MAGSDNLKEGAEGGSVLTQDAKRANQLKRTLTEKVKTEPAAASRLVESWVRGDEA